MKRTQATGLAVMALLAGLGVDAAVAQSQAAPRAPSSKNNAAPKPPRANGLFDRTSNRTNTQRLKGNAPDFIPPELAGSAEADLMRDQQIRRYIQQRGGVVAESAPGATRFGGLGPRGIDIIDAALTQAQRMGKTPVFSGGKEFGHSPGSAHHPGVAGDAVDVVLRGATAKENQNFAGSVVNDLNRRGVGQDQLRKIFNGGEPICSAANQAGKQGDPNHCRHVHVQATPKDPKTARKWICNAYHSEHEKPSDCSDPSKGGRWIVKP